MGSPRVLTFVDRPIKGSRTHWLVLCRTCPTFGRGRVSARFITKREAEQWWEEHAASDAHVRELRTEAMVDAALRAGRD